MFFHPLFQTALVRLLGSRHRRTSTGERKHKCRDCHADCWKNRCDGYSLLTKQSANALSQCGVFMEEPPECLTDSVDLGPGVALFVERASSLACLSISMSESTLSSFLIRSRISLFISVSSVSVSFRCSRARCLSTSDFRSSILVCQLISHPRHCLFEPSQLSFGLGDPHGVEWLIINRRQGALNLFCALTCAVGYAGEVLEFDVIKVAREGFIRLLECLHSGATQTFPRVTSESQRSPQCICTTHPVPRGQC